MPWVKQVNVLSATGNVMPVQPLSFHPHRLDENQVDSIRGYGQRMKLLIFELFSQTVRSNK